MKEKPNMNVHGSTELVVDVEKGKVKINVDFEKRTVVTNQVEPMTQREDWEKVLKMLWTRNCQSYELYRDLISDLLKQQRAEIVEEIRPLLQHYRIQADLAYSEVTDGVHTQEEYERALVKIEDNILEQLDKLTRKGE